MRVLVTGATGFLGLHIIDELLEHGHEVRALVRSSSNLRELARRERVHVTEGDMHAPESLARAVSGIEAVIHCAGGGKVLREGDFREQNTETTANLLEAIDHAGKSIKHLVLISSIAACGPARKEEIPLTSSSAPAPRSLYGQAKLAAESLCLERRERMCVTIVRPAAIYGPGDTRFLPMIKSVQRGLLPLPPGRAVSLVYGKDCANAVVRCLEIEHPSGRTYFVDDGQARSWAELGQHIHTELGSTAQSKRLLTVAIPSSVIYLAGLLNEAKARVTGSPTMLTRDKWRDGRENYWVCASEKTREELGWAPTMNLDSGLKETIRWYRQEGWIR